MDTASIESGSLYSLLGSAQAPLVLDVRKPPAFEEDAALIAGATRPDGDPVEFARRHARGRSGVAYCVKGAEVGTGAAAALAHAGFQAAYLVGGIKAWRGEGLPTIRRRPEWKVPGGSTWITRSRPKIDRIACPWLADPALERLALIVRGADTDRLDLAPQSAGLLAASLGLSQRFPDDHEMLEQAMPMYDGLYAWCRAQAAGVHETHAWTSPA